MSEYEVIRSSALRILDAGQPPPAECAAVGTVAIPKRAPGFFARHSGVAEEEFHRALDAQIDPLDANVLLAADGSDLLAAASSGESFQGTAYRCP